jgi:hypothetical protein
MEEDIKSMRENMSYEEIKNEVSTKAEIKEATEEKVLIQPVTSDIMSVKKRGRPKK